MQEKMPEALPNFGESITLDQLMTPEEAVEKLSAFHKISPENILATFINLRGFTEGTVEFRESVTSGYPCIVMEGRDLDGKFIWNHLINTRTGQPQVRTS